MNFIDFHCDALTQTGEHQVTRQTLETGGCLLQCFAAFLDGPERRFERALALCDAFDALCERESYHRVRRYSDLAADKINAVLTVEEGGAVEGDIKKLEALYERGVRMMTLLWNRPNELGYPNFPDYEGLFTGRADFSAREQRGLTAFGREVVERMQALGMIVDVSHASDGVFFDAAELSRRAGVPFCASHSGAASVYDCARNLTDEQIKALSDCGGVVGLYFCADFLAAKNEKDTQRAAVLAHARAILHAGGENVLCIGGDFDGIPPNRYLPSPAHLPHLFEDFCDAFGVRIAEKIFCKNALCFLKQTLR